VISDVSDINSHARLSRVVKPCYFFGPSCSAREILKIVSAFKFPGSLSS